MQNTNKPTNKQQNKNPPTIISEELLPELELRLQDGLSNSLVWQAGSWTMDICMDFKGSRNFRTFLFAGKCRHCWGLETFTLLYRLQISSSSPCLWKTLTWPGTQISMCTLAFRISSCCNLDLGLVAVFIGHRNYGQYHFWRWQRLHWHQSYPGACTDDRLQTLLQYVWKILTWTGSQASGWTMEFPSSTVSYLNRGQQVGFHIQ